PSASGSRRSHSSKTWLGARSSRPRPRSWRRPRAGSALRPPRPPGLRPRSPEGEARRAEAGPRTASDIAGSRGVAPPLRRERDDTALLLAAFASVPLTWLVLGWAWPLSVSSFDGARVTLPLLAELAAARGDWSVLAYRADWMGGTVVRDTFGAWPVFSWLAALGLSPTAILNASTFFLQALIAFLGVRTAIDLGSSWVPA